MRAYRIVDWVRRYEVTTKGRSADSECQDLKRKPLNYVRSKVYGHSIGPGLQTIIDKAYYPGEINEWAVFGLFMKLLEIAADQDRQYRGWLLDKDQEPIGAVQIAKIFRTPEVARLQQALDILCHADVRWLEIAEFPGKSGDSRNRRAIPEKPGALYNENETETETETKTPPEFSKISSSSDSESYSSVAADNLTQLCRVFVIGKTKQSQSDYTTLCDIVNQLTEAIQSGRLKPGIFKQTLRLAASCRSPTVKKPIAAFIWRMRQAPYNYKPVRKTARSLGSVLNSIFRS